MASGLFSPGELRRLAQDAARTMTTPCAVLRTQGTSDGQLGTADRWYVASDPDLTCRVSVNKSPSVETTEEGRVQTTGQWLIRLPMGTRVTARDRIVTRPDPDVCLDDHGRPSSGTAYEVTGVRDQATNQVQVVLECSLLR